jgi:hypothetical protein
MKTSLEIGAVNATIGASRQVRIMQGSLRSEAIAEC